MVGHIYWIINFPTNSFSFFVLEMSIYYFKMKVKTWWIRLSSWNVLRIYSFPPCLSEKLWCSKAKNLLVSWLETCRFSSNLRWTFFFQSGIVLQAAVNNHCRGSRLWAKYTGGFRTEKNGLPICADFVSGNVATAFESALIDLHPVFSLRLSSRDWAVACSVRKELNGCWSCWRRCSCSSTSRGSETTSTSRGSRTSTTSRMRTWRKLAWVDPVRQKICACDIKRQSCARYGCLLFSFIVPSYTAGRICWLILVKRRKKPENKCSRAGRENMKIKSLFIGWTVSQMKIKQK